MVDGVDKVQTLFLLSVEHPEQRWHRDHRRRRRQMTHLISVHQNHRRHRHHLLLRPVLLSAVPRPHSAVRTSRGARDSGWLGCSGSARKTTSRMTCTPAPVSRQSQRGRRRRLRERAEPREEARPYTTMKSHSLSRPRTHTP